MKIILSILLSVGMILAGFLAIGVVVMSIDYYNFRKENEEFEVRSILNHRTFHEFCVMSVNGLALRTPDYSREAIEGMIQGGCNRQSVEAFLYIPRDDGVER